MFPHIETAKLTAFLLREEKLTEQEEGHLLHCKECMHSMVDAGAAALKGESDSAEPSDQNSGNA